MIFHYFCKIFVPRSEGPPLTPFSKTMANVHLKVIFHVQNSLPKDGIQTSKNYKKDSTEDALK